MQRQISRLLFVLGAVICVVRADWQTCDTSKGAQLSNFQSSLRPLSLPLSGPLHNASTDGQSCDFSSTHLGKLLNIATKSFDTAFTDQGLELVHILESKMLLIEEVNVRVYFVAASATSVPALSLAANSTNVLNSRIAFPNMVTGPSGIQPGDFVDEGNMAGPLHSFLITANGKVVWHDDPTLNSDGMDHVRTYAIRGTGVVLLCWEEIMGGGDFDFNDALVALDVGEANVRHLIADDEVVDNAPAKTDDSPACSGALASVTSVTSSGTMDSVAHFPVCIRGNGNLYGEQAMITVDIAVVDEAGIAVTDRGSDFVFSVVLLEKTEVNPRRYIGQTGPISSGRAFQFVQTVQKSAAFDVYVYLLPCSVDFVSTMTYQITAKATPPA